MSKNCSISLFMVLLLAGGIFNLVQGQTAVKQGSSVPVNFCINEQEMKLFTMVNEYRAQNNLPPIKLSKSLCYVASKHARDLMLYHPDQGSCNFHSWSNRGTWTPFCYPRDETKKSSVWDKPRELTKYPAKAYEIVYWENVQMVPDSVMMVWKEEEYFNGFLLNMGKWQDQQWKAFGIAIFENYVCAWFGAVTDPEGEAYICGTKVEKPAPADSGKRMSMDRKPVKTATSVQASTDTISKSSPTNAWYIIIKTNVTKETANKICEDLKSQSYPDAKVIDNDGKIKISAFGPTDKQAATAKLREVRKTYKDAWLLKL